MNTLLIVLSLVTSVIAETKPILLDPIIAEGTPYDVLKFDPISPAYKVKTQNKVSTGNIAKEIANDLPIHMNTNLRPGNEVTFQGLGKSAEEIDVNVLGIPLNRAQGGGLDLSIFPQFLWSGANYQIGPSLGAYDPRGVSGSLNLRLWTQEAITNDDTSGRFIQFHSTRNIQQYSIAKDFGRTAALIGVNTGDAVGPAGAFSSKIFERGNSSLRFHLLFTDQDVKVFASERTGSLTVRQRTDRIIPLIQYDRKLGERGLLKTAFFYDFNFVDNKDLTTRTRLLSRIHQIGNESSVIFGDTKLGFALRQLDYERTNLSFRVPTEQVANLQATHTIRVGQGSTPLFIEPTVGGNIVTRLGLHPFGTLGLRKEFETETGVVGTFSRFGIHKRYPSLLDRYYEAVIPIGFGQTLRAISNPGLQPETVKSLEAGADYKSANHQFALTGFGREYIRTRYTALVATNTYQVINSGESYIYGGTFKWDWDVCPLITLGPRATYQKTKLKNRNLPYVYSPEWVGVFKINLHDTEKKYGFETVYKVSQNFFSYSDSSSVMTRAPGYYYVDANAFYKIHPQITLTGGVENVMDRHIQFRIGQPDAGRIFFLSTTATF